MSLPNVEWRYVGRKSIGTGTINPNTILDSIYELGISSTYYDGSSRTQGSGSAGIWNRSQPSGLTEAVYMSPPSGDQSIIIAGSSGTPNPTPTMNTNIGLNSAYAVNKLFVNITKNPGSFSAWNSSNPFSSGNAFGYVPFLGSRSSATTGITSFTGILYSYLFESKESIAVFLIETGTDNTTSYSNGFIAGAIIDPESDHSLDAESDGRLYGIFSTGHASAGTEIYARWSSADAALWPTVWHEPKATITTALFLYGYMSNVSYCSGRAGIFIPGSGTTKAVIASHTLNNLVGTSIANTFINSSDSYIRFPILIKGALSIDSFCYGSLRNIKYCAPGLIGQIHSNLGNTVGYVVSCSNSPVYPSQAILLEH